MLLEMYYSLFFFLWCNFVMISLLVKRRVNLQVKKFQADINSPVPLYYQLQQFMIEEIKAGRFTDDNPFPSEKEWIEYTGLSRTTIRQAIENLVSENILEKRRGIGTFIKKNDFKNTWNFERLRSFREEVEMNGGSCATEQLSINTIEISEKDKLFEVFNKKFKIFYKLRRLRYLDNTPAIYVTTYVPQKLTPNIDKYNFNERSLFETMVKEYKINIGFAEKELHASLATAEEAKLLNIKKNSPIQMVKTRTLDVKESPIEYSVSRDRGDISLYTFRLTYRG